MNEIQQLAANAEKLTIDYLMQQLFKDAELLKKVADLNREQLLEGHNKEGGSLMKYVDDPYFKSVESALKYQVFKEKVSPNKDKPVDVMDFFVVGTFHNTIQAILNGNNDIEVFSNSDIIGSVEGKSAGLALGLDNEKLVELQAMLIPRLQQIVLNTLIGQ